MTENDLTAVSWRNKHDVYILTNNHKPPVEGNLCDDHGSSIKTHIFAGYNKHMGFTDGSDRMPSGYIVDIGDGNGPRNYSFIY